MSLILANFLAASMRMATPLLIAALGLIISERAGLMNISAEGAMLAAAFQLPEAQAIPFSDVSPDAWYADAVGALAARGFLAGTDEGAFLPDREVTTPELYTVLSAIAQWISDRHIDLALLNFPWIALPKGRKFIEEYLPDTKIGVIHLPYEADDRNHYVAAARKAAEQITTHAITLFTEFGQELLF